MNNTGLKSFFRHLLFLLIIILGACSSERNTWTSKAYHNTTAHFNGYYYAREELQKIENQRWESMQDDHNRILRLFPALDSAQAKGYDKEIQEAIKMASLAIQRHPNSKWVDDSYLLVGKARLLSLDWGNAIQTYKFVNTKGKDPDAKHRAIIGLIRTFTEHGEYNNGQAAIDYLQKEKLSKNSRKLFALEKAYFYQVQGNLDYMVRSLTEAEGLLSKKDKPGRIYFIIGQVYQKLGFESEAYQFYKKCIGTNPEYEIDFYARLYMAQVTEISRSRNVAAARKSFRKLLKDGKNKDFNDKIYYEMGMFELKQKNLPEAITELNKAVRVGKNKQIDGEAYLRLGEIYYDTLRQYRLSQAYYDSAISSLSPTYEGYAQIKARQEILNEFVTHINTIEWQDSLLTLSTYDSVSLRAKIDSVFQEKKKQEELLASQKKKKRGSNRVQIVANTNNAFFETMDEDSDEQATLATTEETGDWYFANPTAMGIGQTEFKRIWGDVALEDNWRRSLRSVASQVRRSNIPVTTARVDSAASQSGPPPDPVSVEYTKLNSLIPRSEKDRKASYAKIEEAYFKLGDIYNFKLLERENAENSYKKLLTRFPESEYEPEVMYRLYLLYKDINADSSARYAERLKREHPETTFAKLLINPNYLAESRQAMEQQQIFYKNGYDLFHDKKYTAAINAINNGMALGQSAFTPQLELLRILITGKTEDIAVYQFQLGEFIKKYAGTEQGDYAKKLLDSSHTFVKEQEKRKGIQYIRSLEEPHYFVLVYRKSENVGNKAAATLEKFNQQYFKDLKLKTSNLVLNDDYIITLVADLPRVSSAIEYVHTFNDKLPGMMELRNHKLYNFVITKDNFDIFYRTKGLDEYLYFFEKNYPSENQ